MKKIFAAALALIIVLGLVGCSPMDNVPSLEAAKEYSNDDFNEHFKGVNREGLIEVWGEPAGSLTEENADMWDIDDESMVVIYWSNNGKFKSAGINIKGTTNNAAIDGGSIEWLDGVTFVDLAPGAETKSLSEITIKNDNAVFQYTITYGRAGLTLEYGLQAADGTEYSREIVGGSETGTIKNIPAGTYYLFVRNSGDYSDLPAYKDKSISFNATGAINFHLEDGGYE